VAVPKGKTIGESIPSIGGGSLSGVFFVGIILAVALIPFFAFRAVGPLILAIPVDPSAAVRAPLARTEGAGDEGDHQPDLPLARR
jgi:hypothetical protein